MSSDAGLDWLHPTLDECRRFIAARPAPRHWTKASMREPEETVTEIDVEVERLLVGAIRRHDPKAAIISEEGDGDPGALPRDSCYVIDPIDGTDQLAAGEYGYAISVALFRAGQPAAAVVDMPALDRRFDCGPELPTALNGRKVTLHDVQDLKDARLAVSATQRRNEDLQGFWQQLEVASVLPTPAFAAKFGAVLAGDCDAALVLDVHPLRTALWDYAAPAILLNRAGGVFMSLDGDDLLSTRPWAYQTGWFASPPSLAGVLRRAARHAPRAA
jgi:myo-inositol-1(or 4)-monophosphatase